MQSAMNMIIFTGMYTTFVRCTIGCDGSLSTKVWQLARLEKMHCTQPCTLSINGQPGGGGGGGREGGRGDLISIASTMKPSHQIVHLKYGMQRSEIALW